MRIKKLLQGHVEHEVKVTRMKGHGYGVRVLLNGQVNQQDIAPTRGDIGRVARELLRMEDKCGNLSQFAHRARVRSGEKAARRTAVNNPQ